MNPSGPLDTKSRSNPDSLLYLLVWPALVSIMLIILLSGYSFYRIFSGFVISKAKEESVQLCNVMIDQQKHLLFRAQPDQPLQVAVHENDLAPIDRNLRHFLRPFGIIKIKVYDSSRKIVYSTEPGIIGKLDLNNHRLNNALSGTIDAKLETRDKAVDLVEEQLLNVDVVETYVPIKNGAGAVIGSFEVYVNVTPYREQVRHGVIVMVLLLSLVLAAVTGVSCQLIRRGAGQLSQARTKLDLIAVTDVLTGIANRGHVIMRGEEEFGRILRCRDRNLRPPDMGCVMIDIDHFKNVNDTYGHPAGDVVLTELARRLSTTVRPYDVIGRFGGEEFIALLPETSFEQSLIVAERIRATMREMPFEAGDEKIRLTVSLGVSCSSETDVTLNDLLRRADEGLRKAKNSGRDRISWVYRPFDSEIHS